VLDGEPPAHAVSTSPKPKTPNSADTPRRMVGLIHIPL
jgi:hypothetical protein